MSIYNPLKIFTLKPASDSAIDLNNAISIICVNCGISVPVKALNGYTFKVNRYSSRPMRMQYFL